MKTLDRPQDKTEILQRLRTVRPDSISRWGRMSAPQMVCHLSDSFRMALGQKPVCHATRWHQRTIVRWIALYVPVPWPAGIPTRPELDQERGGTMPGDFAADLAELEALLDRVTTHQERVEGLAHPMFGRMSAAGWLRWAYLHTDHHLRQFGA